MSLPASVQAQVDAYVATRTRPSDMVYAILSGDLWGAVAAVNNDPHWDDPNWSNLADIITYIVEQAPGAYGDKVTVEAWLGG